MYVSTVTGVRGGVGESVRRPDGRPKVRGDFAYASDLRWYGMVWGATLRSPHPSARILRPDTRRARRLPGVVAVLTHEDVPGRRLYGMKVADQPVLAADRVRHQGEPVALVAAEHPETARRALRAAAHRGGVRGAARAHRSRAGARGRRPAGP
ncbi:hypothetical protein JQK87_26290 [Streptomyces sp. G44]|nr:hypothetical protein [Streptomyces sp. G44]